MQRRLHAALVLIVAFAASGAVYAQSNSIYLGWRHFQASGGALGSPP